MNNITIAMALETRRAGRSSSMIRNGMMTGMIERIQADAQGSQPFVFCNAGALPRLGQLSSPPHGFQFVARQHGNERCRRCIHERALAASGSVVCGPAQFQEAAAL